MTKKAIRTLAVMVSVLLTVEGMAANKPAPEEFRQALEHITEFDLQRLKEFEKRHDEYFDRNDGIYAEFDFRVEIKQTTTDPADPWFDLYAKGQVYDYDVKDYAGSGNMISPCHMLTAYHVIDMNKNPIDQVLKKIVRFDFFKAPQGYNYTQSEKGQVVAGNNDRKLDYAIVRIDSLRGKRNERNRKVPYIVPLFDVAANTDIHNFLSLSSGNALTHPSKPAALYGMMVRAYSNGYRIFGNINSSHGDSGGSIDPYLPAEKNLD